MAEAEDEGGNDVVSSLTITVPTSSTSCPSYGSSSTLPGDSFSGELLVDDSPSTAHAFGGEPLKEKSPDSATDMTSGENC